MTTEDRSCDRWLELVDDHVDGVLEPETDRALRRHLDDCTDCSTAASELRELLQAASELPRSMDPSPELWTGIESRLAPRSAVAPRSLHIARSQRRFVGWVPRAIAAALLVAFGALSSRLLWPPAPAAVDIAGEPAAVEAVLASAEVANAEAEYLRVKEALWLTIYRNHEELSPMTVHVVEHNLRTIDKAIQDIRLALDEDPGNRRLEGQLFANHKRGIDLLRRLATSSREI